MAAVMSPATFAIEAQDISTLTESDGFSILRDHLAQHYQPSFCDQHIRNSHEQTSQWLIIRDVLHALLVPVVELFDKANSIALSTTDSAKRSRPEAAFDGEAKNAFTELQRFLSSGEQRRWCYTKGCPACVVEYSLSSECSIRLLFAACLLSDVHYPFTLDGPTLPSFRFFLQCLERALAEDARWGSNFHELVQLDAVAIRNGIEDMIHQSLELSAAMGFPEAPS